MLDDRKLDAQRIKPPITEKPHLLRSVTPAPPFLNRAEQHLYLADKWDNRRH
jgi:hypothetical protein